MNVKAKDPPIRPNEARKWREGVSYRCCLSHSCAYKKDKVYVCYKNKDGFLCLKGDDGLEDITHMLCSGFDEIKEK